MRWSVWLLMGACGGGPAGPATDKGSDPTDTALPTTETYVSTTDTGPNPWQVSGEEGSLVTVYRGFAPGLPRGFDVHATFAESLPAYDDLAWCLGGGPCADVRPSGPDTYVDLPVLPDTSEVAFTWVGDEIEVDRLDLWFDNQPEQDFAWYTHTVANKPDEAPLVVALPDNGEWGSFSEAVAPLAPPIQVTQPEPGTRVDLSSGSLDFAWSPGGEGEVYLSILGEREEGDPISVLYSLEDDGEFRLSLDEHGINRESDVRFSLGRRVTDETDLNGNTLYMTGIDEQSYRPECLPYPDTFIPAALPPDGSEINPYYIDIKAYGIFADGAIHDYTEEGEEEPTSARVVFTFLDLYGAPICRVLYDISGSASRQVEPWPRYGGLGVIWDAYLFNLEDGRSNCDPVSAVTFGSTDLRNWLDLFQWGIGIGDNFDVTGQMTYAGYFTFDGIDGIEMDEVHAYELLDCDLAVKSAGMRPYDPNSGAYAPAYMEFEPYYILQIQ